jgi:DNA-binding response OmpR family regulator
MHRGQIITREHLYELLGIDKVAVDTRRLDVHISHLRSKLALNAMHGWKLSSIYQRGYRLEYLYEGIGENS